MSLYPKLIDHLVYDLYPSLREPQGTPLASEHQLERKKLGSGQAPCPFGDAQDKRQKKSR